MTKVRAKFQCNSITPGFNEGEKHVRFHAVYGEGKENKDFSKFTPSGNLDMVISPETKASEFFEMGKEYHLDITLAE